MSLRVVQWATGSVGVAAIKGVLEHPELELVGCWVHSEAKSGKDVGEIIGTSPLGVIATNNIDDVLALDADAVIYAPLLPSVDEVAALLRSGKNVVTPVGWFYPSEKEAAPARGRRAGRQCDAARRRHRARGGHRAVPVAVVGDVHRRDFCSRRRVFRPAHLRRTRCAALRHGFWRHTGQRADRTDAKAARRRLHPVGPAVCRHSWASPPTRRSARPRRWPSRPRRSSRRSG